MKIEKLNDNQIRCTLTKEDLEQRNLKLSELAYGTKKAKALFKEMLRWAEYKYGFHAEDIPIMIEAVPVSNDSIILIVTKVEYPEELDTRFSRFTEDYDDDSYDELDEDYEYDDYLDDNLPSTQSKTSASDIIDLFKKATELTSALTALKEKASSNEKLENAEIPVDVTKLFVFKSLDSVIDLSKVIGDYYHGENALYKNKRTKEYYLIVSKTDHTPEEFNKICNIITEYGVQDNLSIGSDAYFTEHFSPIVLKNALNSLKNL